jgi:hypothetical protein
MRGGGTNASTSYDSFDSKAEAYDDEEPRKKGFWTKKRICKSFASMLFFLTEID